MNGMRIGLSVVLAAFSALSGYAVYLHGLVGLAELATANAVAITLSVDLVIALTLVTVWMWRDARDRGVSPIPYALLTLVAGSVGPLLYLVRREDLGALPRATIGVPTR